MKLLFDMVPPMLFEIFEGLVIFKTKGLQLVLDTRNLGAKMGICSWKFTSKNPIDIVSSQSTQATCFPCGETSPRRHDERSRPSDGRHPAGQKGCMDVTEVDCARSVIYTNKTKLHRNQHAIFSTWSFCNSHHQNKSIPEGHGWRGSKHPRKNCPWPLVWENLTPKLEKKSRQGG